MQHEHGPFSIPALRSSVPEKMKPWIIIAFVLVFQLSGGVYLAAVSEMVGSWALLREDILMAGYASMVGMALTFVIMFRLKFRFTSKTSLLVCCAGLLLCNVLSMHAQSVPVLVAICFIAGIFRMWATFECNSTIQLWITPQRDLSIFFCYVYLLVHGFIQISGLATIYSAAFAKWEYMHWLVMGLLAAVMLAVLVLFKQFRGMKPLPLLGVDWLGGLMWGLTLLCVIFVCVYGEHYDWFDSLYIRMAAIAGVVILALNLLRASFIRHPFIANETWRFPMVYVTLLLYIAIDILLAPSHLVEALFMEELLDYDSLHHISLNFIAILGVIAGSIFTYKTFALRKWKYKTMTLIAFSCILGYVAMLYFTIDYGIPKALLVLPILLRSFGYVIISICFLSALTRVPFPNFFQAVAIQAFVSAACGSVLGEAIVGYGLDVLTEKHAMLLGASLDGLGTSGYTLPMDELYGVLHRHALMLALKEVLGWLLLFGLGCLLVFLAKESSVRPKWTMIKNRTIRRWIKREVREELGTDEHGTSSV
jgi:MFS transporter, DHA2 family, multidrug resistance protein